MTGDELRDIIRKQAHRLNCADQATADDALGVIMGAAHAWKRSGPRRRRPGRIIHLITPALDIACGDWAGDGSSVLADVTCQACKQTLAGQPALAGAR